MRVVVGFDNRERIDVAAQRDDGPGLRAAQRTNDAGKAAFEAREPFRIGSLVFCARKRCADDGIAWNADAAARIHDVASGLDFDPERLEASRDCARGPKFGKSKLREFVEITARRDRALRDVVGEANRLECLHAARFWRSAAIAPCVTGSSVSRSQSPSKLMARTKTTSASPGMTASHHAPLKRY